ncbi:MAG TPA: hypothetical protein VFZ66_13605 [Herpetosiphonaceae bacterium]
MPQQKITAYLLSLSHRDGQSKARFFMRFGFVPAQWEILATALRQHARDHEVQQVEPSPFGTRYVVAGPLVAPDGRGPLVRVVWFIETGETIPRLVTAYPA